MHTLPPSIHSHKKAFFKILIIFLTCSVSCILGYYISKQFLFSASTAGTISIQSIQDAILDTFTKTSDAPNLSTLTTTDFKHESVDKPFTMLFLGDMMFDRGVATHIRKRGSIHVFASGTKALTQKYDLVIGNLEGPITTYPSKTIDSTGKAIPGFSFTFPTTTAALLKESGVDIVSLANNHSDNFGREGLRQTLSYLDQAHVAYFGNPTNSLFDIASSSSVYCPTTHTGCIAFIGYHQFAHKNEANILAEIVRYETDPRITFTIIFPHWGEEYQQKPNQTQVSLAHKWIDTGADLIVGAHPHVVQSMEVYKEKYIYYSLGNYIFDQYFSYDTTHGIAVGITLDPTLAIVHSTEIIPIDITGTVVRKANATDTNRILRTFK